MAPRPWPYAVDFRGFWACPCQVEWIPAYESELQRRGLLTGPIRIYQLIGDASTSGDTHHGGGAGDFLDIPNDNDEAVWVARQMGADAGWHRPFNWNGKGGIEHDHLCLTGCPHGEPYYGYQITAVRDGLNGLANHGPDTGPRPLSGRTWQEGIAWAQAQEDAMSSPKDWDAADWAAFNQHAAPVIADAVVDHPISKAGAEPTVTLGQGVNQARHDAAKAAGK